MELCNQSTNKNNDNPDKNTSTVVVWVTFVLHTKMILGLI